MQQEMQKATKGRSAMKGPEDDSGLTDRVAIVSGGGAAGDGIGNSRAAAILPAPPGTKGLGGALHPQRVGRTRRKNPGADAPASLPARRPRGLTSSTTSKAAVMGLTKGMAVDHARDNIRVNCIGPGRMYTPMVYARGMSDAARAQRAKASLLKTEGTGWDVGHAVKFLLSNYARYITGQVLVVDGGVTLQGPERDSRDH